MFAAALLFSTGGAAIKACSLTSWQIASFRAGIAALAVWALLPEARRHWTGRTWFIGVSYAATLVLFVLANKLTTSANAIFLQSTAPLYLLLLGPLVLREPVRRIDLFVISAVAGGALLLLFGVQPAAATAPHPAKGNLLGLGAGLAWALTLTGMRWTGKREGTAESPAAIVVAGNLIAFAGSLPYALPVAHIPLADAAVLLYLGIFQIGLAYAFLTRSIRHVPGLEAATLLLIEPVFNPIWTWLIHGEQPGRFAVFGGALIIVATFGGVCWQARRG
ncbi:MAG TPA: EamA family transporter [Bryobacteraceae bacterium]|nr:EamA family transporter [Bryobacteraceae bacterium]